MSEPERRMWGRVGARAVAMLMALACGGSGEPTGSGGNGGGGGGGGGGGSGTPPPTAVTVNMLTSGEYGEANNSFSPSTVTIARTGAVTWSNESAVLHNVTFTEAGAPANIPNMGAGSTVRTFPTAGSFSYQCTNHAGMNGTVTVAQ
jgi:plastocyanin